MSCQPPPKYIWRKDGEILTETSKIKISANGTLFLSNLDDLSQGIYELTLENTFLTDLGDQGPGPAKTIQKARIVNLKIWRKCYTGF